MTFTNFEVFLIALSVVETILSAYLYRRMKKRLDEEIKMHEDKRKEYETLIQSLPIGRNLL